LTTDQSLLTILGVLVVANVALVASIALRTRRRRRSTREGRDGLEAPPGGPDAAASVPDAAAIEAFVTSVLPDKPGLASRPGRSDVIESEGDKDTPPAADVTIDPLAALAVPSAWSRAIREESARFARFGHPATVVMAELPRLDALAAGFGRGVADRVAMEMARLLIAQGREADRIAWLGQARFGVLLFETEESAAARYVERVRASTDRWLESVGLSIRLSFGWAEPGADGDVIAAAISAEERMHDASRRTPPTARAEAGRGGGA
jgi:diguanylate cyclase (GGDEF)-like protein